jgi:hypothetical protein
LQAYFRPVSARMERIGRRHLSDPLIVHVENDPSIIWNGEPDWMPLSVYIDDPIRIAGINGGSRDEWVEQARAANAVDAEQTFLSITLQARVDAAVVVESVRVITHSRRPVLRGMILTRPTGGADLQPRRIEIDFDWNPDAPVITWCGPGSEPGRPIALKLPAGDIERFHIWAKAFGSDKAEWCEWSLELLLLVEGKRVKHLVDNNGAPFVTVSPGELPRRFNVPGTAEWRDTLL